ncbi:hypothetical protein [Streptomyces spectabilis]|uniref:Uncharacterized protein n=1 Tax=Streptomyces spectabilis TaxID=68270 RepID=A0A516RI80_STRST|nr:hypothetical protein [Streptomyces spectabilis]QDQ15345.1 hypothetical protein FH965_36250 [Streptomyces spectabilis]
MPSLRFAAPVQLSARPRSDRHENVDWTREADETERASYVTLYQLSRPALRFVSHPYPVVIPAGCCEYLTPEDLVST